MLGKIENPKNGRLLDLSHREFATFAPLLILAFWMGLYPAPFLRRLESSVAHVIARVSPEYATAKLADCGTLLPAGGGPPAAGAPPAGVRAIPGAPFLPSVPRDPH